MNRMYVLASVAMVGVAITVFAVIDTNRSAPLKASVVPAEQAPFESYVVGTGITETGRGNVSIGTTVAGVVREVNVRVGDEVKAGDPLFKLDDRDLQARLVVAQASVRQAEATLAKPRHQLDFLTHLGQRDRGAISIETTSNARDDMQVAEANLAAAHAVVAQIQVEIERLVIRAPAAGRVLQINTRVGEFAANGGTSKPLMLVGSDTRMYLRVDIDENDAWRVRSDAQARAFVRGNPKLSIPMRFEYIEPYVTPKTSLTGQSTERTDLRVLQVIYSFERGALPIYLGQQMDAFIQTASVAAKVTGEPR